MPAQSWMLPHVRWLISRFRDAGEPGWAPPDGGEELLVLALTPLTGRFRHVGREIWVGVEAEPPHLISGLTDFALGSRIRDPRLGAPDTSAQHDVPSPAAAAAGEVIAEHGEQVQAAVTNRDIPIEYVNRRILDTIRPP